MKIKLNLENDILYLNVGEYRSILNLSYLNLVFFINEKFVIVSDNNLKKISKLLNESDYVLIVCNEYEGSIEVVNYLKQILKLNLLNFIFINLYYVAVYYLKDKIIDFENIYEKINLEYTFDKNIIYRYNDDYTDENIDKLKENINTLDIIINDFIDKIKEITIEEIDVKRTNLYLKLNTLEEVVDNVFVKYNNIKKYLEKRNIYKRNKK